MTPGGCGVLRDVGRRWRLEPAEAALEGAVQVQGVQGACTLSPTSHICKPSSVEISAASALTSAANSAAGVPCSNVCTLSSGVTSSSGIRDSAASERTTQNEASQIREWAIANGYTVAKRGRLHRDIVQAYRNAKKR